MMNNKKSTNTPLLLSLVMTSLLFSASACSNPATVNTNNDLTEYKEGQASVNQSLANTEKPTFTTKIVASFDEPWAMTALPRIHNQPPKLLVTQKAGELLLVDTATGVKTAVTGIPKVAYGGQGGLGDIILAADFATSNNIYLSYVEAGTGANSNKFGAKVIKAKLSGLDSNAPRLQQIVPIWQQTPKVSGQGHYSHRLLFSPDGQHLYISSGERQQKTPAQDMSVNLGKIIRLKPNGTVPNDNPFTQNNSDIAAQFWTVGHRNVLGMAFDDTGRLWAHEMGPRGGDEFNLIEKGNNYGWPLVSNGRNYSGVNIPDHDTRPDFTAPKISWTPVISPSSMSIYKEGKYNNFPAWQGNALISGLSSKALIVVSLNDNADNNADNNASERYRYDMGARIRSVLNVDGEVFLLQDGKAADLLKLQPD